MRHSTRQRYKREREEQAEETEKVRGSQGEGPGKMGSQTCNQRWREVKSQRSTAIERVG